VVGLCVAAADMADRPGRSAASTRGWAFRSR
jgi:hypothetical protein